MSELGPEARSILSAGRDGDDAAPGDRARLRASVMRAIAAGGAAAGASAAGEGAAIAKAGGLSLGWKVLAGLAVLGVASGSVMVVVGDSRAPGPPPHEAPSIPVVAEPSPAPSSLLAAPPPAASPTAAPSTDPAPAAEALSALPAAPKVPVPARHPTVVSVPVAPSPDKPPPDNPAPPPEETLAAETKRLREAHGALQSGDAKAAMALLDEKGAAGAELRQERAAARVLALCQLGRVDEAREAGAKFLRENARSPLADRVRASCAGR